MAPRKTRPNAPHLLHTARVCGENERCENQWKNIFQSTRTCVYLYIYEWHNDTVFRVIKRIRLSWCPCVFCRITIAIVQAYACEKHRETEKIICINESEAKIIMLQTMKTNTEFVIFRACMYTTVLDTFRLELLRIEQTHLHVVFNLLFSLRAVPFNEP